MLCVYMQKMTGMSIRHARVHSHTHTKFKLRILAGFVELGEQLNCRP